MAYGTVNADVIGTSVAGSNLGAGDASMMKNRIINGAMVIDQRNAGASGTLVGPGFPVDRFYIFGTQSSKLTWQQNAGSVTPPMGFSNYLGVTSSSAYSVLATDRFILAQSIEGYNTSDLGFGTANAKTVTVSFQVYSSLTGTFGGSLQNYAGTRSYPFTYSVPVANTWTTVSVTIAGDTSGTWVGSSNAGSMSLIFSLGAGSNYAGTAGTWASANYNTATGATSVVGTNGATFYITGVQLEVGSSATGFEYRQYGQELALCQRYLPKLTLNSYNYAGQVFATNDASVTIPLPVETRVAPTGFTASATIPFSSANGSGIGSAVFSSATTLNVRLNASGTSGFNGAGNATCLAPTGGTTIYFNGCEL
jgi:hypothetical protein